MTTHAVITIRSSSPQRAHRLLQETLITITAWTTPKVFRFSSPKMYKGSYSQTKECSITKYFANTAKLTVTWRSSGIKLTLTPP